ncbi:hypothetical protein EB796_003905 [Bugula neritina]|uniref:Uncharacterized protein n=1 Tax=Bugula neritina TaxID=10212 RepID=A0A7J7KHN4_BUGNE|nr:hypothetical protein EB796_003905 [Bugula neritina]
MAMISNGKCCRHPRRAGEMCDFPSHSMTYRSEVIVVPRVVALVPGKTVDAHNQTGQELILDIPILTETQREDNSTSPENTNECLNDIDLNSNSIHKTELSKTASDSDDPPIDSTLLDNICQGQKQIKARIEKFNDSAGMTCCNKPEHQSKLDTQRDLNQQPLKHACDDVEDVDYEPRNKYPSPFMRRKSMDLLVEEAKQAYSIYRK